jgi:hypothetical protein
MKKTACVFAVLIAFCGCSRFYQYSFVADPSAQETAAPYHLNQPGFFMLRYQAYQGSNEVGGTLNEIAIRNTSEMRLKVASISLDAIFKGRHVTKATEPIQYTDPGVFGGFKVTGNVIGKGEWMYFVFPTENITDYSEGDKMKMKLGIELISGSQRYSQQFDFAKKITRKPLPWP